MRTVFQPVHQEPEIVNPFELADLTRSIVGQEQIGKEMENRVNEEMTFFPGKSEPQALR